MHQARWSLAGETFSARGAPGRRRVPREADVSDADDAGASPTALSALDQPSVESALDLAPPVGGRDVATEAILLAAIETIDIRSVPPPTASSSKGSDVDVWLAGALSLGGLLAGAQGGRDAAPATAAASGVVVDGYVAHARVFRDGNGNGRWDAEEAYVYTDGRGRFAGLTGSGPIAAEPGASGGGGTTRDLSTGVEFRQSYSAPEGSRVITPLTTVLAAVRQAAPGLSATQANERVTGALGLDSAIFLMDFDPQASTALSSASVLEAQRVAAHLANFLAVSGAALQASGLSASVADSGNALRAGLAQAVLDTPTGERLDFTSADAAASWLRGAAERSRALRPSTDDLADQALATVTARCLEIGRSLANVAAATAEASSPAEIAGLQIVAQSTVVASLSAALASPQADAIIAGGDASGVRAEGRQAASLVVSASGSDGGPTVQVTVDRALLHEGARAAVSIQFSEPVVGALDASRFSVVGGRLDEFSTSDGRNWQAVFTPDAGFSGTAALRLTGEVRNAADRVGAPGNLVQLTVDTAAPTAPQVALARDTGVSAFDLLSSEGRLEVDGVEPRATLYYSADEGANWATEFTAGEGENRVWLRQVDSAGNFSATTPLSFVLDTVAPELTISAMEVAPAHGPVLFRFAFSEPVSGFDVDDIVVAGGEKGTFTALSASLYTLQVAPTSDRTGSFHLTVAAASAEDRAGNFNRPASHGELAYQPPAPPGTGEPGQATVDLGAYGQLIAPVFVDGRWYYYWDRSGDGSSANLGNLNGGSDKVDHNSLDRLFNRDSNGVMREGDGIESHRYATLNGVRVALPTAGESPARRILHAGTAIDNLPAGEINLPYDDLLAIWDGYNGSGAGLSSAGVPTGWAAAPYWSATPLEFGHAMGYGHAIVDLRSGELAVMVDQEVEYVALQLIDVPASERLSLRITDDTAAVADGVVRFTFTFSAPVSGFDLNDITLDAGCQGALVDNGGGVFTLDVLPPANASGEMHLTVAANVAFDAAGVGNPVADASQSYDTRGLIAPGAPVIDLGEYGKLIAPVHVDDAWFYYWDRSGDGSGADRGALNGGVDAVDFTMLATLFGIDEADQSGSDDGLGHDADDEGGQLAPVATLQGVRVVLPSLSDVVELREALRGPPDDDASPWECLDAFADGADNARGLTHSAWQANDFWTAQSTVAGHLVLALNTGRSRELDDQALAYAVVQVI